MYKYMDSNETSYYLLTYDLSGNLRSEKTKSRMLYEKYLFITIFTVLLNRNNIWSRGLVTCTYFDL